jgi:hypothetical protein
LSWIFTYISPATLKFSLNEFSAHLLPASLLSAGQYYNIWFLSSCKYCNVLGSGFSSRRNFIALQKSIHYS